MFTFAALAVVRRVYERAYTIRVTVTPKTARIVDLL